MEQNDFDLLTKIGDGDMVAMEKKYHNHCFLSNTLLFMCLHKGVNNVTEKEILRENDNDSVFYGIALSDVINHIKKTFETSTGSHPFFLLVQLMELFNKTHQ